VVALKVALMVASMVVLMDFCLVGKWVYFLVYDSAARLVVSKAEVQVDE